jgi:hypothetical protein
LHDLSLVRNSLREISPGATAHGIEKIFNEYSSSLRIRPLFFFSSWANSAGVFYLFMVPENYRQGAWAAIVKKPESRW